MDFKSFFKKLFSSETIEEDAESNQFLKSRSQLVRSESELKRYAHWKANEKNHFISNLRETYFQNNNTTSGTGIRLYILDTASSKGFICQLNDERYHQDDFQHLLDYLMEKILELDYRNYLSDVRTEPSGGVVLEMQRHYLKPRLDISKENQILDQQFGNITIEFSSIYNEPKELKFICHVYNDSKFKTPDEFEKLIFHLFIT